MQLDAAGGERHSRCRCDARHRDRASGAPESIFHSPRLVVAGYGKWLPRRHLKQSAHSLRRAVRSVVLCSCLSVWSQNASACGVAFASQHPGCTHANPPVAPRPPNVPPRTARRAPPPRRLWTTCRELSRARHNSRAGAALSSPFATESLTNPHRARPPSCPRPTCSRPMTDG